MAGATRNPGAGANYGRDVDPDVNPNVNPSARSMNQAFVADAPADGAATEHWTMAGSIKGALPDERAITAKNMAVTADPLPLGLVGFAAATFTVSTVLAGWFGPEGLVAAIPVLIVFGGIAQFLAGMWAYARGNVLATVAFGSFGSFNVAFGILLWMNQVHFLGLSLLQGDTNVSLVAGVFVLMFALISGFLAYAALADNLLIAAVLGFLSFAYLCDGVALWIGGHNFIGAIGGYSGIVASLLAFYAAAAIVVNAVRGREALPFFAVHR